MARATCRCGQPLEMPREGADHVVCPQCAARVRIIRKQRPPGPADVTRPEPAEGDGYIRFSCPCGRRLKVSAIDRPTHGKCPDCGSVVPVPAQGLGTAAGSPESPTEEMAAADLAALDAWARGHAARASNGPASTAEMTLNSPARRAEAGMRVCPQCGKPIHLGAVTCRSCGTSVPKR